MGLLVSPPPVYLKLIIFCYKIVRLFFFYRGQNWSLT